ncbi:MAG: SusC/RagA family TonB-linked outer membrane protein [Prevotellaceae bacterium]|nr:SusC/RagA family TonB-linked outer membrane protein [Prevotellaceae bacterium]
MRATNLLRYALLCVAIGALPALGYAQDDEAKPRTITGHVVDDKGVPLVGVSVLEKGTANGAITNAEGNFSLRVQDASKATLTLTFLGLQTLTLPVSQRPAQGEWNITMKSDEHALDEVVVTTGIISRNRLGFTGAYVSVSQEELKAVGNTNVLQSLKSLDPAFVVVENTLAGSNPNAMLNIEVRGQTTMNITSVQDEAAVASNQPLFILDGFEATLQEINDIDINRVESITILKDAGSTAIYGSKGANGVVVVETIKPKGGEIFVSYTGDVQVAQPDLSVYNMMNAAEKLEFERLAGRYDYNQNDGFDVGIPAPGSDKKGTAQASYYQRLAWVQQGVDTYWLSEPVRTGITQGHSLTIAGGENALLFAAGLSYRSIAGVMKGSERNIYGGNLRLVYRGFSGLNISNNVSVSETLAQNGSWGSFSDFANANPYFRKYGEDGRVEKYLDVQGEDVSANPLYNALLNTRHDSKVLNLTNNTSIEWTPIKNLMFKANFQLRHSATSSEDFVDPSHTQFRTVEYDKKGTYTGSHLSSTSLHADAQVNYMLSLAKHNLTFIGRANIEDQTNISESYTAVGFPEGAVGYPKQAFSYQPDARPTYNNRITRGLGAIVAFNYNYDFRYLFDVNYNLDGSTNFGSNRRFQSFWSVGVGWNLHRERFAEDWTWLRELKLRGTYGNNGNQSVSANTNSIYTYYVGNNYFGQSAYLSDVGNPDLQWQVVQKAAAGVDASVLKGNLRVSFDVYQNYSDPLTVTLSQRPSTGVSSFATNMGHLTTQGYEFSASYFIINRDKIAWSIRATGGHNRSTYGGFQDALSSLNDSYVQEGRISLASLVQYQDGHSPSDLWAVRSLGIDPATGREIFLDRNGNQTYQYDANDRVVIASTRPDIEGVIGTSLRYKKFSMNFGMRYSLGAYTYNTALFNKVENISSANTVYNQDKRALYDRWQKPGDVAQFKKIGLGDPTPTSSRFIQKNNFLRGESGKITWDFTGDRWLKFLRLKDLNVSISFADIFQLTSIQVERGIDYPFQRAVTMNISARF